MLETLTNTIFYRKFFIIFSIVLTKTVFLKVLNWKLIKNWSEIFVVNWLVTVY